MKSDVPNTDDEIEVVDEKHGDYGRIRIRERQGAGFSGVRKCSIYLTPDQLDALADECIALAITIRKRR